LPDRCVVQEGFRLIVDGPVRVLTYPAFGWVLDGMLRTLGYEETAPTEKRRGRRPKQQEGAELAATTLELGEPNDSGKQAMAAGAQTEQRSREIGFGLPSPDASGLGRRMGGGGVALACGAPELSVDHKWETVSMVEQGAKQLEDLFGPAEKPETVETIERIATRKTIAAGNEISPTRKPKPARRTIFSSSLYLAPEQSGSGSELGSGPGFLIQLAADAISPNGGAY